MVIAMIRANSLGTLADVTGMRKDRRLSAMKAIVEVFYPIGAFTRSDVYRILADHFSEKCLSRALGDMASCGMLDKLEARRSAMGANGAVLLIADDQKWHRRNLEATGIPDLPLAGRTFELN